MNKVSQQKSHITIYTPESQLRHPGQLLHAMFSDILRSREVAWRLAVRDISAQYRQTFLGFGWAVIMPIVNTVVWIFLQGSGIITLSETDLPYPVYVFTGTMLWQIFVEAFNSPNQQVNQAKAMLSKLNFPRESIILSGILQTMFNAFIKIIILTPALLFFGIYPNWSIFFLPLGIFSLILSGTALGLLLVPLGALYQDVTRAIPLITQLGMYITPVVFPLPKGGWASILFNINPLTPLILTSRDWLTGIAPSRLDYFFMINGLMAIIFLIGWIFYRVTMPILIERMNA
jgi:lipopolysaccharide transport system permease protein